jgi:hypothetical protein
MTKCKNENNLVFYRIFVDGTEGTHRGQSAWSFTRLYQADLAKVLALSQPIPCSGLLGLRNVPSEIAAMLEA